jgi:hypothetical protein
MRAVHISWESDMVGYTYIPSYLGGKRIDYKFKASLWNTALSQKEREKETR